ncbi:MAG TPA: DUF3048 domain-containing protein [Acidimicrobiales bacterium]|nr:DUF3048 domain-containing protein [Acidimicrobiales bacterium]
MSRRRGLGAAALVLALVAGACGGGSKKAAPKTTTTMPLVTTTTEPPPPAVLTNLPLAERANLKRPALVVKVENAPEARPQAGIDKADVVYEEVVEGGVVRFLCVFQSQDAASVGPVRSVRPVDPDIVSPLKGYFAYSGGAPQFVKLIKRAPVTQASWDDLPKAYTERRDRPQPHHLFTSTAKIYGSGKKADGPPPQLFTYGTATGAAVTHATVVMGSPTKADWDWDAAASRWKRTTNGTAHVMEDGTQLAFANVVVQYVRYSNTTSRDPSGSLVPTATVVGSGTAMILSGATMVQAKWTKRTASDVTAYTDAAGLPINVAPGPTWVMLAPLGAQTTTR